MWFAALSPAYARAWLLPLVVKLLEGDPATVRLLGSNPFPDKPPTYLRAVLYRYRFSTPAERRATGTWWVRELVGEYLPAVALHHPASDGTAEGSQGEGVATAAGDAPSS